jgi:beta-lactamase class A
VVRAAAIAAFAVAVLAVVVASAEVTAGRTDPEQALVSGRYPTLHAVSDLPGARAVGFPGPAAVQSARAFAAERRGRIAFAVGDGDGDISGQAFDRVYHSASLVKAMILVAYLDRVPDRSAAETAWLDGMIRVSDNYSASQLFKRLGPGPLRDLARRAGLKSFTIGDDWAGARVTAADQVRFFLALDRLLPRAADRDYARYLLSHVAPFHSWGIPEAARPLGWQVYFKGGWRPDSSGQLVHQAGLLERGGHRIAIAVLTDGSPSESYAHDTIRGVAEHLLGRAAQPGVLMPIRSLG